MATGLDRQASLDLVREIRAGSVPAWHRFLDQYAGLIHAVAHRYLTWAGEEARRDVFAEILEKLLQGGLDRYDGRSRLSTWLFIYCRSRCLDHLRTLRGRRGEPRWLKAMSALDRRVFRLHFLEGLGTSAMLEVLASEGRAISAESLSESLDRLDERIDDGARRRMAFDLGARSVGLLSGRLLEFLHGLKIECEERGEFADPEQRLFQQDVARATAQVAEFVSRLPELERRVITLRFYEGRTAREASRELSLQGQREVYSVESRALRRLRGMFES